MLNVVCGSCIVMYSGIKLKNLKHTHARTYTDKYTPTYTDTDTNTHTQTGVSPQQGHISPWGLWQPEWRPLCSVCTPALPAERIAEHNNHNHYPTPVHTQIHIRVFCFFYCNFCVWKLEYFLFFSVSFCSQWNECENNFNMASRKMVFNHTWQQK